MQEICGELSFSNILIKSQYNYITVISILTFILSSKMKSPYCSYFDQVSFVKNPVQNGGSLFFKRQFVIKAPKGTEKR